ncbi:cyclase family protein [Planococcus sp. YIM B11945]|uniref:cyclase family protein n=1 Tax=Planococcus sp. YIM B11945 TaxID=3435410 RepID=UPI003D7C50D6
MKFIDISSPIYTGMPVYKDKPEKQPNFITNTNGHVTESRIEMDAHTGTHIDAPLHMINDGETFETIPLEDLVRQVKVLDFTKVEDGITKADLEQQAIDHNDFLLFKTSNSFDEGFNPEFIFLKEDGARYLADLQIKGVGTDALGIERSQPEHPTHRALFKAGIVVIEGLQLGEVEPGSYFMVAAPLNVRGIDAAPARVLLFENEIQ